MKKKNSKYTILLLLAVLFAAPGLSAYLFFQHPQWLGRSTLNKGQWVAPPVVMNVLGDTPKWRMILWNPGPCDSACLTQLDTLARARLALGRLLYDVDLWLVLGENAPTLNPEALTQFKEKDIHQVTLTQRDDELKRVLSSNPKVLLANKENYLILSYKAEVNPDDVYQDLKRLLK